jgi:hypothetical protein
MGEVIHVLFRAPIIDAADRFVHELCERFSVDPDAGVIDEGTQWRWMLTGSKVDVFLVLECMKCSGVIGRIVEIHDLMYWLVIENNPQRSLRMSDN